MTFHVDAQPIHPAAQAKRLVPTMAEPPPTKPTELVLARKASEDAWVAHLQQLFHDAKNRYPDVVWQSGENDASDEEAEEIWGHKGMSRSSLIIGQTDQ